MKMNKISAFLAAAVLVAACSAAAEPSSSPIREVVPLSSYTLHLKGVSNPEVKTSFGNPDGSKMPLLWSRADALGLFVTKDGADVSGAQNIVAKVEKSKGPGFNTGTFLAKVDGLSPGTRYDVRICYPYYYFSGESGSVMTNRLCPWQRQPAPGSSAHIGRSGGFAVASAEFTTPAEGESTVQGIEFELEHKTAYIWYEVSAAAGTYTGWSLKRIVLTAPEGVSLAGSTNYDFASGEFTLNDRVSRVNSVSLDIESPEALSSTPQSAYMVVFPTSVAGAQLKFDYYLSNPAGDRTVILSHTRTMGASSTLFSPGKLYHLMEQIPASSGGEWTEGEYTFDSEAIRSGIESILRRASLPSVHLTYQDNLHKETFVVVNNSFYASEGRTSEGSLINEDSIYEAASVSKVPFAYVPMKMYDDGELDLDRPLYEYWPGLLDNFVESARENAKLVTARLCLLHMTGMPNGGWGTSMDFSASYLPVGSRILYSGQALCVLQKVIEHIKGKDFDEIARDYIFSKIGMDTSAYLYSKYSSIYENAHTYGYPSHTRHTAWESGVHATLRTNSIQFNQFLRWFLDGSDLSPEVYEEMMRPYVRYNANNMRTLGWFVEHHEELGPIFWHNGINGGGFRSWAFMMPERGVSLCWFVNATYSYNIQAPLFGLLVGNKTAVGTLGGMTALPSDKTGSAGSTPIYYYD